MSQNLIYRKRRWRPAVNRKMLGLLVLFFVFLLLVIALESPIGRIGKVEIEGLALLNEQEALEYSGLQLNTPLIRLLLSQPEKALLELPEVKEADVRWRFPNEIHLRLVEYKPVATWETARGP